MSNITQKCKVQNCGGKGQLNKYGNISFAKGYCVKHYYRFKKYGDPNIVHIPLVKCKVKDCEGVGRLANNGIRYFCKGYCGKHYTRLVKYGDFSDNAVKHLKVGTRKNKLYSTYSNMKERCYNPKNKRYNNYGGRGITVCDRWLGIYGFSNFIEDMGERPEGYTLDRIDNDKGYSPENCRWATPHQQASNKRNNNEVIGVSYSSNKKIWAAELIVDGARHRKWFKYYDDAVKCRKEYENKYSIHI